MIIYFAVRHFYINHLQPDPDQLYILTYQKQIWDFSPALKSTGLTNQTNLAAFHQQHPFVKIIPLKLEEFSHANQDLLSFCHNWTDQIEVEYPHAWYCRVPDHLPLTEFAKQWLAHISPLSGIWGGGSSKIIAKIAAHAYHSQVIPPDKNRDFLAPLGLNWLPIPQGEELTRLGITTIGELLNLSENELVGQIGAPGKSIAKLARGEDITPFQPRQLTTISWEADFTKDPKISCAIGGNLLDNFLKKGCKLLAEQLAAHNLTTNKLGLWQQDNYQEKKLSQPSANEQSFYRVLQPLLISEPITSLQLQALALIPQRATQLKILPQDPVRSQLEKVKASLGPLLTNLSVNRRDLVMDMWEEQYL